MEVCLFIVSLICPVDKHGLDSPKEDFLNEKIKTDPKIYQQLMLDKKGMSFWIHLNIHEWGD